MENQVLGKLALILSMADYIRKAFMEGKKEYLKEIMFLENELDRIYWFGVRQLLMVQKNRALAKFVGIESALHILGNRTILKVLELAGDYLEEIAKDLDRLDWAELEKCVEFRNGFAILINQIEDLIGDALRAYNGLDVFLANEILKRISELEDRVKELTDKVIKSIDDVKTGVFIIKSLTRFLDMARNIGVVCEIVINRAMEDPKKMLKSCVYKEI